MLEYLLLSITSYSNSYRIITAFRQYESLRLDYYKFEHDLEGPHYHDIWTNGRSNRWLKQFDKLHCEGWQDHYYQDIWDGTQWNLIYTCEGHCGRRISGSNAYPDNWSRFMKWIHTAIHALPEVDVADLDDIMMAIYESPIYRNGRQSKKGKDTG